MGEPGDPGAKEKCPRLRIRECRPEMLFGNGNPASRAAPNWITVHVDAHAGPLRADGDGDLEGEGERGEKHGDGIGTFSLRP